jgi:hypothetical protein
MLPYQAFDFNHSCQLYSYIQPTIAMTSGPAGWYVADGTVPLPIATHNENGIGKFHIAKPLLGLCNFYHSVDYQSYQY